MNGKIKLIKDIINLPSIEICFTCTCNECRKVYDNFTKPHPKYKIIKHKSYGVELIEIGKFKESNEYIITIKGKNSADYYSRKALKSGYVFHAIEPEKYKNEILQINTSTSDRQGRAMDDSYLKDNLNYPINDHHAYFGISKDGHLVAYLWFAIYGELAICNRLLGHADYLKEGVMYLMLTQGISHLIDQQKKVRFVMYDTFFGASDGLKLFKTRIGFKPFKVKWNIEKC